VCALTLSALSPGLATAQVSVEVSPLRVELQAQPGATSTQAILLTNVGNKAVRVRASLADWHLSRDGAPQFEEPAETRPYSAASWIRFAPPELLLEPGARGTVRFTVTVPQALDPAGYRTGILFDFSDVDAEPITRARQVLFKSRIATLIYIHVGQPVASVELLDLATRTTPDGTRVVAVLRNTSRRSVRTKGSLIVYDGGGLAVREVPVPDVPVLPESERELAIVAVDAGTTLPSGDYRVELKIDVGQAALLVGETSLKVAR
jgi:hypothetical protein